MKKHLFDDADVLVRHLFFKNPHTSPLKLQMTLYFLFAYYGSFYGSMSVGAENLSENHTVYPPLLFSESFEATKYGPEIRTVKEKLRRDCYFEEEIGSTLYPEEVLHFLSELIEQFKEASDFAMVERSHQDKVWMKYYKAENHTMNPVEIIEEYLSE